MRTWLLAAILSLSLIAATPTILFDFVLLAKNWGRVCS